MGRLRNSIELAKTSLSVLRADKELLLLPVLSFLAWIVVAATFVVPILMSTDTSRADGSVSLGPAGWVLSFVGYVVLTYVTVFFNTAIVSAADERLRGGDPTLGSALRGASDRAGAILPWAVLSATVSIILRALEERAGFLGRLVIGLIGLAWSLVTFLVLPVLVIERVGVVDAVKRSAELFKRTWGENVVANAGIGVIGLLAVLAAVPILLLCIATGVGVLAIAGIVAFVAWVGIVAAVSTALTGILQVALYRFAVDGRAPEAFAGAQLDQTFTPRAARRFGF
jgi:hypothetical protein